MKSVFIITSVIAVPNRRLSYSATRSVFGTNDRIAQTRATIHSIRDRVPDARILFIEIGQSDASRVLFSPLVDHYVHVGNKKIVRMAAQSLFKGLGEAAGLLSARRHILDMNGDLYFKISGRYTLTPDFSADRFSAERFSFLKRGHTFSTRLYSFPRRLYRVWIRLLIASIPFLLLNISIEHVFCMLVPRRLVSLIKPLGVAGTIAPTGELIEE